MDKNDNTNEKQIFATIILLACFYCFTLIGCSATIEPKGTIEDRGAKAIGIIIPESGNYAEI